MLLNPRSPLYKLLKQVQAAPFVIFSIGVHAIVFALLMQISWRQKKSTEIDLVLETKILDEEPVLLDPQELLEKLAELTEEDVEIAKPDIVPDKPVETPVEVTEEVQEVGETLDQEAPPGDDEIDDAMEAINSVAMGDAGTMVVAVGDWDSGPGGKVNSYKRRKSRSHRVKSVKEFGGNKQTENAVLGGLAFLAKYQQPDGHWSSHAEGFLKGMKGNHDIAVTGLSLLGFLGAGHTERTGKYSRVVSKAVNYLRRVQFGDGRWQDGGHWMYTHGIVTMAMSEAYGMSGPASRAADAAQRGINYIVRNQPQYSDGSKGICRGGFGYSGPGNDTSVTGWQLMACKSAIVAGLKVPDEAMTLFGKFFDDALDEASGKTAYRPGRGGGSIAMTSVGLVCRLFLGQTPKTHPVLTKKAKLIDTTGPQATNVYYLYYGTLGQFQMGGDYWKSWNERFAMEVASRQVRRGKLAGSWDYKGVTHADRAGPAYSTAMYILSLEVYYRYLPLYQK